MAFISKDLKENFPLTGFLFPVRENCFFCSVQVIFKNILFKLWTLITYNLIKVVKNV